MVGKRRAPKAGDGRVGAPPWKQALGASAGSVPPPSGYGRSLTPDKLPDRLPAWKREWMDERAGLEVNPAAMSSLRAKARRK